MIIGHTMNDDKDVFYFRDTREEAKRGEDMFGIIGTLVFGAMFAGAWISAESTEQNMKKNAQDKNLKLYHDKNGKLRNAKTGRRATQEEIHEWLFGAMEREEKRIKEGTELKYWGFYRWKTCYVQDKYGHYVKSLGDDFVLEIFDNHDDCQEEFLKADEEWKSDLDPTVWEDLRIMRDYWKYGQWKQYSEWDIQFIKKYHEVHYNFEKEGLV